MASIKTESGKTIFLEWRNSNTLTLWSVDANNNQISPFQTVKIYATGGNGQAIVPLSNGNFAVVYHFGGNGNFANVGFWYDIYNSNNVNQFSGFQQVAPPKQIAQGGGAFWVQYGTDSVRFQLGTTGYTFNYTDFTLIGTDTSYVAVNTVPPILIDNINLPPVITSNGGAADALVSSSENSEAVTSVTATDPDANTPLTYSIVGGADSAKFQIDSSTGALSFINAPNFEAPTDANTDNVYDVLVEVSDGALTDTQEIFVTVLNQSPETVVGTIGDDEFLAAPDREAFDGRAGSDTVSYRAATAGVVASLTNPASNTGFALGDTYVSIENLTGSNFNDTLTGDAGDNVLTGGLGNDVLSGGGGNDLIVSDGGNDRVDGGVGVDTLELDLPLANVGRIGAAQDGQVIILETTSGVEISTTSIESFVFSDQFLSSTALLGAIPPTELMATSGGFILPDVFPGDPTLNLQTQYLGSGTGEIVSGTSANDFMNLAGGDDAADGRGGNDVLDGGIGSNFLTGGPGSDTFFLDGRGGTTTWSTITDFTSGEDKVNVWGWQQGVSKLLLTLNNSGAAGYTGATYHYDLDGNNSIDTSITFSGRTLADIRSPTVNQVAENQYLLFL